MVPRQTKTSSVADESIAAVRLCLLDDLARISRMAISPYDGSMINVNLNPERQKAVATWFEQLLRIASIAVVDDPIRWAREAMVKMLGALPEYSELLALVDRTAAEERLRSITHEASRPASTANSAPPNPTADTAQDSSGVSTEVGPRKSTVQERQARSAANEDTSEVDGPVALGRWADQRLPEAQSFVRLLRGGTPLEELQKQFPALFSEVFNTLYDLKREAFFEAARCRKISVPDLLALLAEVKEISGSYLSDCRKKFRNATGKTRKTTP